MAIQSHIESLKSRHQEIDNQLQQLTSSLSVDSSEIAELKRQKLRLKDRISTLAD